MKSRALRCAAVLGLLAAAPGVAWADVGTALVLIGSLVATGGPIAIGAVTFTAGLVGYALVAAGSLYGGIEARKKAKAARAAQVAAFNAGLQARTVTALSAEPPHRCVYGRCVTGGDVMAIFTTDKTGTREDGSTYTKADALQHLVIHLQTRQAHAIHEVFIDGVPVGALDAEGVPTGGAFRQAGTANRSIVFTGSASLPVPALAVLTAYSGSGGEGGVQSETVLIEDGGFTLRGPVGVEVRVSYTVAAGSASVRVRKFLGAPGQLADSYLSGLVPDKWTAAHRGQGMAGLIVTLDLEDTRFQGGIPNITADMSGALLYDPRKDGSIAGGSGSHRAGDPATWEWSDNAALCTADFLASEMGYGVDRVLDIDIDYQRAAANDCDVAIALNDGAGPYTGKRYTCNGAINSDMPREKVLQDLEDCMAGVAVPAGQWLLMAGAWTPPVLDLTDADLAGSIEVVQADTDTDNLLNSARATFIAAGRSQPEDARPPYTNPVLVAADQGVPLWGSFTFPFTNSNGRVRNLLRIQVERKRSGLVIQYPAKLRAWGLQVGMRVRVSSRTYALDRKLFRISDRQCGHQAPVLLTLQEDAPEIWDEADTLLSDPTPNTGLPDPFVVPALAGLAATSGTATLLVTADGTVVPQVALSWAPITSPYVVPRGKVLLRWRSNASLQWRDLPPVPGDAVAARFAGVQENDHLTIEARVRNTLGQLSPPVYIGHVVQGKSTPASAVAGFGGAVSKGRIPWVWSPCPDADYGQTEVRATDANWGAESPAPLFRGKANGWQEVVSAAGNYTRYARHVDLSGNPSTSSAVATVSVTAADLVQDGAPGGAGAPGLSVYTAEIFVQGVETPAAPSGGTFNFATSTLTPPVGFTAARPAFNAAAATWRFAYTFSGAAGSTVTAGAWTGPAKVDAAPGSSATLGFFANVARVLVGASGTATASIRLNTDGTITTLRSGLADTPAGNWYVPTTPGIGSQYSVLASQSGDAITDLALLNTPLSLASARTFSLSTSDLGSKSASFDFAVIKDASSLVEGNGSGAVFVAREP